MKDRIVIAADIAKNVFECVKFKNDRQVGKVKRYKRDQFGKLLISREKFTLVMETCSGAQHWARLARQHGHKVILIPPKVVSPYRHGQKTDANDAMAIYEASRRHQLKASVQKTVEQQGLSALESVRSHYQDRKKSLSNAIRGHLAEFGIVMPKGYKSLRSRVPLILEDAENGLPMSARLAINEYWEDWQRANQQVLRLEKEKLKVLNKIDAAKELLKIEGIGPVSTSGLICVLGDGSAFKRAKEAAAFIGTSPKQHSSGGKEVILGISKTTGHKKLRSALIQGARSVILRLAAKGEPSSEKERWLAQLIERQGENRAAVALANKNVRTAWALLAHNRQYIAA
jgi:transposase